MRTEPTSFDPIHWVEETYSPAETHTPELIYDHMESQSGRSLPGIYLPFDATNLGHISDRGLTLDFYLSTCGALRQDAGQDADLSIPWGRVLDFGPGDGWPSLNIAPYCRKVVGVDGSTKRVQVCRENAARMGINNAKFLHVLPGDELPFKDHHFDAVCAASSVEQTPDPKATLRELCRVLKPGGRLRMHYEALNRYKGSELEAWIPMGSRNCTIMLYTRDIPGETVKQYALRLDVTGDAVHDVIARYGSEANYAGLTAPVIDEISRHIISVAASVTRHPSGATYKKWLKEVGFSKVIGTHSGGRFARKLFEKILPINRPTDLAGVDAMLRPALDVAINMPKPIEQDPMITAVR